MTLDKVLLVAGARPNFMRVAPIIEILDERGINAVVVHTGQHYDPLMSDVIFEDLGLRTPNHHLGVDSGSHAVQIARMMEAFEPVLLAEARDMVAAKLHVKVARVKVARVEVSLRSRDRTMPEEVYRVAADRVADFLATTADAADNLRQEDYPDDRMHLVGHVMVGALPKQGAATCARTTVAILGLKAKSCLITSQRPSNVDEAGRPASSPIQARGGGSHRNTCTLKHQPGSKYSCPGPLLGGARNPSSKFRLKFCESIGRVRRRMRSCDHLRAKTFCKVLAPSPHWLRLRVRHRLS